MKTSDFNKSLSSNKLKENISKQFNVTFNLENYSREQLEDMRNKLRTRIFQQEGKAGINDLLTNEAYQKDKAMLALLNTRIKEMLGEDLKRLKDKMAELSEAKKGVRAPKYTKKSKGSKGSDQDGDGKPGEFDDVQVARMTAGGVPKKKAIAKATSDKFNEDQVEEGWEDMKKAVADRNAATQSGKKSVSKTGHEVDRTKPGVVKATKVAPKEKDVKEAAKKAKNPFAVGMAAAKKEAGIKKTPATDLPKQVVKKGHEIGKSIKKSQKDESVNIFRRHVKIVNESLQYLINEDEEEKAKAITAASDIVNDFTSWMQRVGQYQTKVMIELSDNIRHDFSAAEAEAFKQAVGPALQATLETLTSQRELISSAVATLAGEQLPPTDQMGQEPASTPELPPEPTEPDSMNEPAADEFAASDAAAGAGTTGRELRESSFHRRLAESHSIISILSK